MSGGLRPVFPPATGFLNSAEEALWKDTFRTPYIYSGEKYLIGSRYGGNKNEFIFVSSDGTDVVTMGPVYNILYNEYRIRFNRYLNR